MSLTFESAEFQNIIFNPVLNTANDKIFIQQLFNNYHKIYDIVKNQNSIRNYINKKLSDLENISNNPDAYTNDDDNDVNNDDDNDDGNDVDIETTYTHIIPPYTELCSENLNNGCVKKGAFISKANNRVYCWFHIYSQTQSDT